MNDETDEAPYGKLQLPFRHSYLHGWIYPPFVTEATLQATKSFQLRESDVVIATFPKNGTSWTQNMIRCLHGVHNTGLGEEENLAEFSPWIEAFPHQDMDTMPSPRYLKTHNSYDFVAYNETVPCKYIYIARNPKDVCVSLYHHCKAFLPFNYDGPFEEYSGLFLEGKVESGDWWVHVKEYFNNARNMNILFLKYEDIHADGIKVIKLINDFCDLPQITDEQAAKVQELATFRNMKKDPKANSSWMGGLRKKDQAPFMRKGTVGDWANFFTKEMSDKFDEKSRRMFADVDLDFTDHAL